MMELTCAFILIFASIVSASPHGYGVKGGASAKAEASASAFGGIGEVPVAVPLGSHVGSFSKSSASSFSSSSASSSASSSSFSYSGSGAGASGFGSNDGAQGNGGCSSGNCQSAGTNGLPHGTSHNGNTANANANAAAVAGASAVSGSGCQGHNCGANSGKCSTGHCTPKSQTGVPSVDTDTAKCASGNCGPTPQSDSSPTESGSNDNDIRVMSDLSKSSHNSNDKTEYNSGSDCYQGSCAPSAPSSPSAPEKQHSYPSDAGASSYHKPATHLETPKLSPKCNSANCDDKTPPSSYNVPIHGIYDNGGQKPACNGAQCENQPKETYSSPNSNTFPTNYLNPQHSTDNYVTKEPSSPICGGSKCTAPSSQITEPSYTLKPGSVNYGQQPVDASLNPNGCKTPNCSPYPANSGPGTGFTAPSGHIPSGIPSEEVKPSDSNSKLPPYTGGFGGPAGLFKPNEFNLGRPQTGYPGQTQPGQTQPGYTQPSQTQPGHTQPGHTHPGHPHPGHTYPGTTQNSPSYESTSIGCSTPSCTGHSSPAGVNKQPGNIGVHQSTPNSNTNLPPYTGGFGGPDGMLKPNEYNIHATVPSNPNYAHPGSSSYNKQPSSPINEATGCNTQNCGYYPTSGATSKPGTGSGPYDNTKPSISNSLHNEKLPAYTGGFGSPGGVLKPNEYNTHITGPSGHIGCKTPNCYPSNIDSTGTGNTQSDVYGISKPGYGSHPSSVPASAYPSGYDKPSSEISAPALTPSYTNTQSPSSPIYSTGCKTGNCAVYPSSSTSANANAQAGSFVVKPHTETNPGKLPQYTGSFGGPSGTLKPNENPQYGPTANAPTNCKTNNCAYSPSASAGAGAQTGPFAITKPSHGNNPSNEKLPTYTGGFGGASGLLKPNEYSVPPVNPSDPHKPLAPSSAAKPVACTSGKCNTNVIDGSAPHSHNNANGAHATAAAADDANAVPYTGGFGGPPGVLTPYDNGKAGATHTNSGHHGSQIGAPSSSPSDTIYPPHKTNPGSNGPSANTGTTGQTGGNTNTDGHAGSIAGSAAYSGAVAGATSGTYGFNTHGPYSLAGNTKGASPCGGGCGGPSGGAYNGNFHGGHDQSHLGHSDGSNGGSSAAGSAAKSLAGASSFGTGGSFASSSASAHASAGAYTKGGYGKR